MKRLFTAIENGQAAGFKPAGVLADFVEVDPASKKRPKIFCMKSWNTWSCRTGTKPSAASTSCAPISDGRATFLVHPEPGERAAPRRPSLQDADGVAGRLSDHLRLTNGFTQRPADLLPRLAAVIWPPIAPRPRGWRSQYPDAISCCRTASATTATPSAAERKPAADRWL